MGSNGESSITVKPFGSVDRQNVEKYTLRNDKQQEVDVITYGATITAVRTPDKNGKMADVVLGYDNIEDYLSSTTYFGATIGRVANRIAKAKFTLDGVEYNVGKNSGENSLHGGVKGWNTKIWRAKVENDRLIMNLTSPDGDEGFPGDVTATVIFQLKNNGELCIQMKCLSAKATPINLTNHAYFNLAGHGTNAQEVYKHRFVINADKWTVTDAESIPTGELRPVENSPMDFRTKKVLGDVINKVPGNGYDWNFCLTGNNETNELKFVAKAEHPDSGRFLEVFSNQPGVQFYTSNFFPEMGKDGIDGKDRQKYYKHGAFCLETQNYPDAVNHENFPNSILRPNEVYDHIVTYKFGVEK